MSLSRREMRLLVLTVLVMLVGATLMVLNHQLSSLRSLRTDITQAQLDVLRNERELLRRPELLRQLERVRAQLPIHPEGRDVRSDFSRQVQSLARQSGLRLTGLTPGQEEEIPDINLHQLSIRCAWSGDAEALVGFLVRMQALGAVMDVRELRMRVSPRSAEYLSGSFTVDFAFSRSAADNTAPNTPTPESPDPDTPS